jgi:hypothetical protein
VFSNGLLGPTPCPALSLGGVPGKGQKFLFKIGQQPDGLFVRKKLNSTAIENLCEGENLWAFPTARFIE